MLQIQTNVTKELQAEWQFNLTKMFPDTVDCFSPSNNMYILVEEQSKIPSTRRNSRDLLTLDTDFDCTSAVFVGNFIPLKTFSGVVSMKNNVFFRRT